MKTLWFTVAVIVAVVLAVGAYVYKNNGEPEDTSDDTAQEQKLTPPPPPSVKPTPPPAAMPPPASPDDSDDDTEQPMPPPPGTPDDDSEEVDNGTTWTGTLKTSDKAAIGNLMLIQADSNHKIYINTSRDYSALINKEVVVTYSGTINDFSLVDIKAK